MIKKIANFCFNLIMSFLVLGMAVIVLISNTVLKKDFVIKQLEKNNFYERTYGDIKKDFENYTMQSGLELEILDGLFSKEKVKNDIKQRVDGIYSNKNVEVETDSIINELDNRINSALEKNNRTPSDSEKESIQKYEDAIRESYRTGILYGRDFHVDLNYFKTAKIICISGIIIICIALFIINKSIFKSIAFIGINMLFSGILCISVKPLLENKVQHILLLDAKFSKFLVSSINEILVRFHRFGVIAISVGIALIIFGSLEKMKKTIENK